MEKTVWNTIDRKKAYDFASDYITFLNKSKTERLCTDYSLYLAEKKGFTELDNAKTLKPGDKVYAVNRGKSIVFAIIGKDDILNGINLVAAHIDSPRLDLKPNPVYEDLGIAMAKTHYYGGIKKYQWTTIPLSLIGTVVKENGEIVEVNIGEDDDDPVFTITDLRLTRCPRKWDSLCRAKI